MEELIKRREVNVYCDESCHLENDHSRFMVLGSIRCPKDEVKKYNKDIIEIKQRHNRSSNYEVKWNRLYGGNIELAIELIDYFFKNDRLKFRGYIIDKKGLDHNRFTQNHDIWYYKMYYRMLEFIIEFNYPINVYLDIKDTRSGERIAGLQNMINRHCDTEQLYGVRRIQAIQSHEVQLMQIVDLIIGALRYHNEGLITSKNKSVVIERIMLLSGFSLKRSVSKNELKFNIFFWQATYSKDYLWAILNG